MEAQPRSGLISKLAGLVLIEAARGEGEAEADGVSNEKDENEAGGDALLSNPIPDSLCPVLSSGGYRHSPAVIIIKTYG
jgi:hypothetical protein